MEIGETVIGNGEIRIMDGERMKVIDIVMFHLMIDQRRRKLM